MMGENVICFSKDWDEEPTSNNHVMVELAKNNRVLWLNSIATRTPKLSSGRDLKKIVRKLVQFARGAKEVRPNLWVYTPIVLPLPHARWSQAVNRAIVRLTVRVLAWKLGLRDFQLWTFLPNTADYVGRLGESVSVYYCVDDWAKFNYVDGARIAAAERKLLRKVDVVFAVSQSLVDDRIADNPRTHLARHGVDHDQFAAALSPATEVPSDLASIPRPVIGFYGTLQDWVDFDLLCRLADRHREWSVVLIGKALVDLSRLKARPNIHVLPPKPHALLPAYCRGFAVGLIPYALSDRLLHVNPLKLREYLSAGVPVVSTALPEVRGYASHCTVARDDAEFEQGVREALMADTPERRRARSEAMRGETWTARVAEVGQLVLRAKTERQQNGMRPHAQPA